MEKAKPSTIPINISGMLGVVAVSSSGGSERLRCDIEWVLLFSLRRFEHGWNQST